jgi:hypothetical protein
MGMLRTLVIVGAALVLMPSPPRDQAAPVQTDSLSALTYMAAAAETMADVRSFCQRNPNLCATAGTLAETVEGKAKYSAKLIYEWANGTPPGQVTVDLPADLAAVDGMHAPFNADDPQNTLTLADLKPAWRKPNAKPQG